MTCDVSRCNDDAVLLVHFRNVGRPYPYCERHATRWKRADGRWQHVLAWSTGVESTEPIITRSST